MPPKAPSRDAKAAKTGSSDEEQLVTSLVARITRTDLEGILASTVLSGAVPRATVEAMLPAHERTLERARKAVAVGGSREGTGLFDDLDDELVCNMLARLPLLERVRAVSAVCRSWRWLKTSAELWEDVTDMGQGNLNCSQLLGLLNWLPGGGQEVRICRLKTDKQVHATLPPKMIKRLPGIQHVKLEGPKIYGTTLAALAKASARPPNRYRSCKFSLYRVLCCSWTVLWSRRIQVQCTRPSARRCSPRSHRREAVVFPYSTSCMSTAAFPPRVSHGDCSR
mmetsp:Transcript_23590/g.58886  ORF Transcript_23590/g.58886 Transcript_23590/m.58886 type:complete len:281 (-) Transcript_23590:105-947(-)